MAVYFFLLCFLVVVSENIYIKRLAGLSVVVSSKCHAGRNFLCIRLTDPVSKLSRSLLLPEQALLLFFSAFFCLRQVIAIMVSLKIIFHFKLDTIIVAEAWQIPAAAVTIDA